MGISSRNAVISDKMQFPNNRGTGSGSGVEIHPRQWFPDDRDSFILWLRGEFAAANAIIDSLCHHLRSIGDPGDYDFVIGAIHQRRCNWSGVLHLQQYFSIAEVIFSLQQVILRKEQRRYEYPKVSEKDIKKTGQVYRQVHKPENTRDNSPSGRQFFYKTNASDKGEGKADKPSISGAPVAQEKHGVDGVTDNSQEDCTLKEDISIGTVNIELKVEAIKDCGVDVDSKCNIISSHDSSEEEKLHIAPKLFTRSETFDGNQINVVEGLKLYEGIFESSEISKLFFLANELRAAGRRGDLQGQAYIAWKRPVRGHGREIVQLGPPIADGPPEDENTMSNCKDKKMEAIPNLLQGVIDRMVELDVVSTKPDSCTIDFFNEGDYSHPYMYPPWYERPVSVLFLTDCDMVFGRIIGADHPGEYKGSLELSLVTGSLLVTQGRSADFAKHAISSLRKQRILVTFTKCCPKKYSPIDGSRPSHVPLTPMPSPPVWGPPPSKSSNFSKHPSGLKHYGVISTTSVLAASPIRAQPMPSPSSMQPLFVAAPAVPFPAAVHLPSTSTAWQPVASRHPPPRLFVPGTGVFLPPSGPGQSQLLMQQMGLPPDAISTEAVGVGSENGAERVNCSAEAPLKGKLDMINQKQECNGSIDEKEHQNGKRRMGGKQISTVKL